MPLVYPDVNGQRFDHASIELTLFGQRFDGFKSIDYASSQEPTLVYGNSRKPVGRTGGQNKPEASLEMYRLEFDKLAALIKSRGGKLHTTSFGVVVNYTEGADTSTDELIGCRISKINPSSQEGSEAATVKLTFSVMGMKFNGVEVT